MTTTIAPTTETGRAGLRALRAEPARALVALDFDGTLAPIVPDPEQARSHPAVLPALRALAPRLGTLAVVTGRPAAVAARIGGFDGLAEALPNLLVLGQYGAERWEAAGRRLRAAPDHPGLPTARQRMADLVRAAPEGTWLEDKGQALAVHTRRAADPAGTLAALDRPLRELAASLDLAVEPGRMVLELRPPGMDKGAALRALAAERSAGSVLYAGDDLGDLPAFAAVRELRGQGVPGLLVCSAPTTGEPTPAGLAEAADLVVPGPEGVAALLRDLLANY